MSGPGTLISTAQDFPRVAVYERAGKKGKIYTLVFNNLEYRSAGDAFMMTVLFLAGVLAAIPAFAIAVGEKGVPWWAAGLVILGVLAALFQAVIRPRKVRRAIVLDIGGDTLRVLKNGRGQISRALSRLSNLTVQDHPDAEFARVDRSHKRQTMLRQVEKQHCLFGWFGAGGAEQVLLLSRAEWPTRHSLFEVRQAILWAQQMAAGGEARTRRSGMGPPLD